MTSAVVYDKNLNKQNESVCGDNVQIKKLTDSKIIILSDGLGSGIKASILSILTTEIIGTLFENKVPVEEIVDTITKTLPVCKHRGIAYSTFTIIQIFSNGVVKIVNYDNPDPVIIKGRMVYEPKYTEQISNNKRIRTAIFNLQEDDFIFAMSDGLVHAGIGNLLDFGWGTDNLINCLMKLKAKSDDLKHIVDDLIEITYNYYEEKPGDDSTLIGIKITEKPRMFVFTGPPLEKKMDRHYVEEFLNQNGTRVICGGTTSNIVSRITGNELEIQFRMTRGNDLPPYGLMKGVDLVTEGVLTLQKLNKLLDSCEKNMFEYEVEDENIDGAHKMFVMLRNSDEIDFTVGRKVNAFYHNPALPFDMSIRSSLIRDITGNLKRLGKIVTIQYC
ncbi:MAG TPA: SpoIIE family protein phosphatase [Thermotogota bacterium]|nr:SpoIIE family protein phosphatase [Thermotogota bacterium]HPJ88311.1 SpoIIE family protein phosphatase [Thermotogota bacterium]HPR95342.1 SpoIIE family protein phosphatase [Thermotogota bacterium]